MAAIERVRYMKSKTRGKIGDVALKLDMSKVCERIDWNYLHDVMFTLRFYHKWIH